MRLACPTVLRLIMHIIAAAACRRRAIHPQEPAIPPHQRKSTTTPILQTELYNLVTTQQALLLLPLAFGRRGGPREELGEARPAVLHVVLLEMRGLQRPGGEAEGEAGLEHEGQPGLELDGLFVVCFGCGGGVRFGTMNKHNFKQPCMYIHPSIHLSNQCKPASDTSMSCNVLYLEVLARGLEEGVGVGPVRGHARVQRGAARDEALLGVVPDTICRRGRGD